MRAVRFGLIQRIALLVVTIEIAAFGVLGWFYVHSYSSAADEHLRSRLRLVASMVANEELPVSAMSRKELISDLLGAPYLDGMVVGGSGRVIVATDPAKLGRPAAEIAGIDAAWFAPAAPTQQEVAKPGRLTGVSHLRGLSGSSPIYYTVMTVDTAELDARKRSIALWGEIASLLFVLLTSAGVVLAAQRLITRRIGTSLEVVKTVEEGALGARIPVTANDELGQLQQGINSMTRKLGALLERQRQIADDLQSQKDLLQSVIEHAPIRVFWKDAESRFLGCNSLFARDAGLERPEQLIGMSDFDMGWRDQAGLYREDDARVMRSGVSKLDYEEPQTTPDGRSLWLSTSKVPLRAKDGRVIGVLGVYADVTERKQAEEELMHYRDRLEETVQERTAELRLARDAAEAANKAKSVFLANMSHELRTPLNAILGFSRMMRGNANLSADQAESLDIINRSGEHLLDVINDVLEMAKIEAGRLQLEMAAFDLGAMVRDVADMMRLRAEQKGLSLRLDQSSQFPRCIRGDEARLRQILVNLVGNAVKFTSKGGVTIRLGARQEAHLSLLIEVEDSGPGIGPEDQQHIFRPFVQLAEGAEQHGTGLGLAITKQFVELMGGRIEVDSKLGRGSRFRVSLPVEVAELPAQRVASRREVEGLAPGQPRYRILIAEDQRENQLLLTRLMDAIGLESKVAENGEQCVELFRQWRPDLIWMDRRMPVMDGVEATRRIRQLAAGKAVKIVAVTASAFKEQQQELFAAGMDDYVSKPFRFGEIYDCLARQLGLAYVYRAEPDEAAGAPELTSAMLAALPPALRAELGVALEELDSERIEALIGEIGRLDRRLGAALSGLARKFDYAAIMSRLDAARN